MTGPCRGEVAYLLFLDHRVHFHYSILRQTWKMSKNKVLKQHSFIPQGTVVIEGHQEV